MHDSGPTDTAGDGGPATEARIWTSNMAVGPAGDIYFEGWDRFRVIDSSGIVHPFAGPGTGLSFSGDGGPALKAGLSNDVSTTPVAADPAGNVYLADPGNYRIRRVDRSGIISTIAGTGVYGHYR